MNKNPDELSETSEILCRIYFDSTEEPIVSPCNCKVIIVFGIFPSGRLEARRWKNG